MPDKSAESGALPTAFSRESSDLQHLFAAYPSTAGLCILDSKYRYVWVSQALAALHGVAVADHLGKTPSEVAGELGRVMEPQLSRFSPPATPFGISRSRALPCTAKNGFTGYSTVFPFATAE